MSIEPHKRLKEFAGKLYGKGKLTIEQICRITGVSQPTAWIYAKELQRYGYVTFGWHLPLGGFFPVETYLFERPEWDDNPEWTDEMFSRAKPLADVFPDLAKHSLQKQELKQARGEAFIMGFAACLLLVSIAILIWWAV